jgi:hypothetical protein
MPDIIADISAGGGGKCAQLIVSGKKLSVLFYRFVDLPRTFVA